MASNMLWCKSLTDLKQYDSWMNTPGEKHNLSSIFFDYELVFELKLKMQSVMSFSKRE
jgi:signal-transduction protein with cAMP-binding, CBS, and nucleotidyltransferase domain